MSDERVKFRNTILRKVGGAFLLLRRYGWAIDVLERSLLASFKRKLLFALLEKLKFCDRYCLNAD
jgi:hypothetical protein